MIGPGRKEIDVRIQSKTGPLFQYLIMVNQKTDITLTSEVLPNDATINVSAGHGFTGIAGEYALLRSGDLFAQWAVISVNVNELTLEMPIDFGFPLTSSVTRGNVNMNVDGDAAPTTFEFSLSAASGAIIPINIKTLIITMQHGANVPDDGKFGGLAALTKGLYFRKFNGDILNLGNYQTNQEFKAIGGTVEYTAKAPAGTNGTNIYIELENIYGNVIQIDPAENDGFIAHVRDNIDSGEGMAGMTIALIGAFADT